MLSSINNWATAGSDPSSWSLGSMGFQDSLKPYMADLLLLKGIDYKYIKDMPGSGERTGHACFPGMLTGAFYKLLSSGTSSDLAGGISVDQYIGTQLQKQGYKGLVSLNQGTFVVSTGHLSWSAAGQVVLPNPDPASVFSLYFKGMLPATTPPTMGAGGKSGAGGAPPVDNTAAIQRSILDYVISDINRFSKIVGSEDKQRIDQHLTSVRAIESPPAEHRRAAHGRRRRRARVDHQRDPGRLQRPQHGRRAEGDAERQRPRHHQAAHGFVGRGLRGRPDPGGRHADLRPGRGQPGHELAGVLVGRSAGVGSQHGRHERLPRDRAREHDAQGHLRRAGSRRSWPM